jgi:hypothetical protein
MSGKSVPDDAPLAAAPPWLLERVVKRQNSRASPVEPREPDVFDPGLDLKTHPGVDQGSRNEWACRLIGAALARGEDPETVEKDGLEWARRCNPPMDDGAIKRMVSDFALKDAKVEQKIWPVLGEAALHGIAGEVVRAIGPSTEADSVAILAQFLAYFGNVIGRSAFFVVEATRHHTVLFVVLVGQTAKGRKGTSEFWVREIFKGVDETWAANRVQSGLSSGEGLIWAIRDPIKKTEPIKEKGVITGYQEVVTDPGVTDKRLLVRESEFASVLSVAKREGNTVTMIVREAYDSNLLQTLTKNSPARATGGHIAIVGHITNEELRRDLEDVDGFNGFANRYLWLCVRRSKLLPEGGPPVVLTPYIDRLKKAVDFAKEAGQMSRDAGAGQLWAQLYKEMATPHGGMFGAITSRSEAHVLRLSMVFALLDSSVIIRTEHLQAAMAVWRYAEDSARYIFGDSTGDPLADKVLAIIRGGPVSLRDIHARTNRHLKAKEIGRVLGKLSEMGVIKSAMVATGGRPAQQWSLL